MSDSLQSRFAKGTIILLVVFSLALATFLGRMFHHAQIESEQNRLKSLVYSLISAMDVSSKGVVKIENLPESFPDSKVSIAIFNDRRENVWSNGSDISIPEVPKTGEWNFEHFKKQDHASQLAFGLEWSGDQDQNWKYTIILKDSGEDYRNAMTVFHRNLWSWLSIGCFILLSLQLMLLRLGFKPLQQIADEVSQIEQGKQHKFEKQYPTELNPLTVNINSLLRHERGQQLRYQQSLDNLAHALKTPLTAIKNLSQQKDIHDGMLKELDEQVMRAKDIVDYQLRKAAAVGKSPFAKSVHISEIIDKLSRSLQKVYVQKNIQFEIDIPEHSTVKMDEGDLFEVVGNIMENAAKYCKSKIKISFENETLIIEDDGTGFSDQNIQSIVQRGVRQDQRTEGSGIGLSVAYEIISVFGGSLELNKSPVLGGALVKIHF